MGQKVRWAVYVIDSCCGRDNRLSSVSHTFSLREEECEVGWVEGVSWRNNITKIHCMKNFKNKALLKIFSTLKHFNII